MMRRFLIVILAFMSLVLTACSDKNAILPAFDTLGFSLGKTTIQDAQKKIKLEKIWRGNYKIQNLKSLNNENIKEAFLLFDDRDLLRQVDFKYGIKYKNDILSLYEGKYDFALRMISFRNNFSKDEFYFINKDKSIVSVISFDNEYFDVVVSNNNRVGYIDIFEDYVKRGFSNKYQTKDVLSLVDSLKKYHNEYPYNCTFYFSPINNIFYVPSKLENENQMLFDYVKSLQKKGVITKLN